MPKAFREAGIHAIWFECDGVTFRLRSKPDLDRYNYECRGQFTRIEKGCSIQYDVLPSVSNRVNRVGALVIPITAVIFVALFRAPPLAWLVPIVLMLLATVLPGYSARKSREVMRQGAQQLLSSVLLASDSAPSA
jgi:hypothetical protein